MTASELDALDRRLDEGEALEWNECLDVLEGLIKALREAHSREEKMQKRAAQILATSYDAGAANLVLSLPILPLEPMDAPKDLPLN